MENNGYVKVMRSYDYCHFEVCLPLPEGADLDAVNFRRKEAAILADEAVREYKIAKQKERDRDMQQIQILELLKKIGHLKNFPLSELPVRIIG